MKPKEISICGLGAVQARFKADAGSIKRLFFDNATSRKIGAMCKALAGARKVYRCVEPAELEKIAGTLHHGGIVAIVEQRPLRAPTPEQLRAWGRNRAPLLLLDRIGNAHNLGAIARTAAFFGVTNIVVPDHPQQALPGEAAHRVAKPVALVLGNEEAGLSAGVASACELLVTIPGSGLVESLNVGTATAVLCWEFFGKSH